MLVAELKPLHVFLLGLWVCTSEVGIRYSGVEGHPMILISLGGDELQHSVLCFRSHIGAKNLWTEPASCYMPCSSLKEEWVG